MSHPIRNVEKGLAIAGWSGAVVAGLFGLTAVGAKIDNGVSSFAEYQHDPASLPSDTHISESLQNSGFDAQASYDSSSLSYDIESFAMAGLAISASVAAASFVVKKVIHEDAASAAEIVIGTRDFDPPHV